MFMQAVRDAGLRERRGVPEYVVRERLLEGWVGHRFGPAPRDPASDAVVCVPLRIMVGGSGNLPKSDALTLTAFSRIGVPTNSKV